jgi:hypothetical protein
MGCVDWQWISGIEPPTSDHPNHTSALACKEALGAQLDAAERLGMIEYVHEGALVSDFVSNIIPLGAVIKPDGKVRMLVDPSLPGVNDCMMHLPCSLPSAESIFLQVSPTSYLGKRDLDNGFFHVVLSPSARRHMGFRHPVTGRLARWVVLPQGTKQSPAIFCAMTEAAARIFNRICKDQGIPCTIFVYVDDFIFVAESHAALQAAFAVTDYEAAQLGLSWNPRKDVGRESPLQQVDVLGLHIDAATLTLSLPASKQADYSSQLELFHVNYLGSPTCPRKVLEQLLGKLVFTCRVCRWGYLFVQSILDALYPAFEKKPKVIHLTEGIWHDLSFWRLALAGHQRHWLGMEQSMTITKEVRITHDKFQRHIFSDASKTYGVGGILGPEQVISIPWERDVTEEHIGSLELEAALVNLRSWAPELADLKVLVWMDNIQAVCALNKGASRIPALRATLLQIAILGMQFRFTVRAAYIKGEHNPADAPSRGKPASHEFIFTKASEFNNPPADVDAWVSSTGIPSVDGCTLSFTAANPVWNNVDLIMGRAVWAAPPYSAVAAVMGALVEAWVKDPRTTGTIVVPDWPTATWYRRYLRRKQPLFQLLERFEAGSQLFKFRDTGIMAPPCKFPILVLRIGNNTL